MRYLLIIILWMNLTACYGQRRSVDNRKLVVKQGRLLITVDDQVEDTVIYSGVSYKLADYRFFSDNRIDMVLVRNDNAYYKQTFYENSRWVPSDRSNTIFIFSDNCRDDGTDKLHYCKLDKEYLFKIEDEYYVSYIYDGEKRYTEVSKPIPFPTPSEVEKIMEGIRNSPHYKESKMMD